MPVRDLLLLLVDRFCKFRHIPHACTVTHCHHAAPPRYQQSLEVLRADPCAQLCRPDTTGQEVHAIVGESGAGKSTLIKVLAGARLRDAGQILLEGIAQRTYTMASKGLQLLYDLKHNNMKLVNEWQEARIIPLPNSIDTGTIVITRENVSAFKRSSTSPKRP